jgi:pyruvate/2-oxoglutarate dehydrogenase complex dihydrolipoamide dehydrogenase (E3) component
LRCSDLPDIPRDHFRVADDSSVATRRNPNTEGLGLELTGVELTDREYIKVNERLQTTAPGVWAIGEVAGSPQFTHISVDDFRVVHTNLTGGNQPYDHGQASPLLSVHRPRTCSDRSE